MIANFLIAFANKFIAGIGGAIQLIVNTLPASPFTNIDTSVLTEYMGYINWIVPVNGILTILGAWCGCIAIYYVAQIALRWLKVVE